MHGADVDEVQRLRREYETSLSWRLTRPVRAAGHMARRLQMRKRADAVSGPPRGRAAHDQVGTWLAEFYGERLEELDAACAGGPSPAHYALFRDLDDDAWSLLLTQQYDLYPNIRALLPSMPEPALQEIWNGASGLVLAGQSRSFYTRLRNAYERWGDCPLAESSVLDFGCGWGRLTRFLLRDVAPGRLYGCDPVEGILELCRANRVGATFARSAFMPERVPFDERFDLAFAFSVFTHLSEAAHERSLLALHRSLRPGAILILTIRPVEYLSQCDLMHPLRDAADLAHEDALESARYLFVPHAADPRHPQAGGSGQIEYGETVITMAYVRERWSSLFELLESHVQVDDLHQVILTMRRT